MAVVDIAGLKLGQIGDPSGWASLNANALAGVLMPMFMPPMIDQIKSSTPLWDMFVEDTDTPWVGGHATFPVNMRRDTSLHGSRDDGPILDGRSPEPVRGLVNEKWMVSPLTISDGAVAASKGNPNELVDTISYHMGRKQEDFTEEFNRYMFLDGTGRVAASTAHNSGNPTTFDTTQYLLVDKEYEVWNLEGTLYRGNVFVTALQVTAATATLSTSFQGSSGVPATMENDDVLVLREIHTTAGAFTDDASKTAMLGLAAHVDDGTLAANHESIARLGTGAYTEWQSLVLGNSGTARDWSTLLMHRLLQGTKIRGRTAPDLMIAHDFQQINISEFFQPFITPGPGGNIVGGFSNFKFESGDVSRSFVFMDTCQIDRIYALNRASFKWISRVPLGFRAPNLSQDWSASNSSSVFTAAQNQLRYNAAMVIAGEFVCNASNRNGVLTDLDTDIPVFGLY